MSMTGFPRRWDWTGDDAIVQGADDIRYVGIDLEDLDTGTTGTWDITGYTARMTVRPDYGETPVLSLTTENGRISTTMVGKTVLDTTLGASEIAGETVITLASTTGVEIGHTLGLTLDDASRHNSLITNVAGTDVTIADSLPSAATSGNTANIWDQTYSFSTTLVNSVTAALTDWGRGIYDMEIEDPFGHVTRVYYGHITLSREASI